MFSSWDPPKKSRRYRKRIDSVPSEIDVVGSSPMSCLQGDLTWPNPPMPVVHPTTTDWSTSRYPRVHIIPGQANAAPGEPDDIPPTPTDILRIVIVGDPSSGKTSLVRSFVYREELSALSHKKPVQSSSHWSLDYHKKDVTFWHACSNDVACVRLQLWDVSGIPKEQPEFDKLLDKAHAVFCVVSVEHGLDHLIQSIQWWKKRLCQGTHPTPTMTLFLHKSDLLPTQGVDASDWIQLGSQIGNLTSGCEFYMTSCACKHAHSVHISIMKEVRRIAKGKVSPNNTISIIPSLMEAKAIPIYSLKQINDE